MKANIMHTEMQKHHRVYQRAECVVFCKTRESYGGLSNMSSGYPLLVNDVPVRTVEALYQACRFPLLPEVQKDILDQKSPMTAKMKSKPRRSESRPDWNEVRFKIMRWCLRVKLAQNYDVFSDLLLSTGDKPIVEHSRNDDYWGARGVDGDVYLVGENVLGRLLMELRERIKSVPQSTMLYVAPLNIPDFLLFGKSIGPIAGSSLVQGGPQFELLRFE